MKACLELWNESVYYVSVCNFQGCRIYFCAYMIPHTGERKTSFIPRSHARTQNYTRDKISYSKPITGMRLLRGIMIPVLVLA